MGPCDSCGSPACDRDQTICLACKEGPLHIQLTLTRVWMSKTRVIIIYKYPASHHGYVRLNAGKLLISADNLPTTKGSPIDLPGISEIRECGSGKILYTRKG